MCAPDRRVGGTPISTPRADHTSLGYASEMPNSHRIGCLLLIIGYLGVVGGTVAWIVSYWDLNSLESPVYQAAFAIGVGLAGLACWRWTVACRATHMSSTLVRGPTRWMAGASWVMAAVAVLIRTRSTKITVSFTALSRIAGLSALSVAYCWWSCPYRRSTRGHRRLLDPRGCCQCADGRSRDRSS